MLWLLFAGLAPAPAIVQKAPFPTVLNGQLTQHQGAHPVVTLEHVPHLAFLHTLGPDSAWRQQASVAPNGSFSFVLNELPAMDGLYRLHFGSPQAAQPGSQLPTQPQQQRFIYLQLRQQDTIQVSANPAQLLASARVQGPNAEAPAWQALRQLLVQYADVVSAPNKATPGTVQQGNMAGSSQPNMGAAGGQRWQAYHQALEQFIKKHAGTPAALVALQRHAAYYKAPGVTALLSGPQGGKFRFVEEALWINYPGRAYTRQVSALLDVYRNEYRFGRYINPLMVAALILLILLTLRFVVRGLKMRRMHHMLRRSFALQQVPQVGLSRHEADIWGLLVMGKTSKDIAQSLDLERAFVKSTIKTLLGKMGLRSRKEIKAWLGSQQKPG